MKVEFKTQLRVERALGGWILTAPFAVEVDDETFVVPEGFFTDFASVPRLPLAYYLAGGRGPKAATLHDFLYETKAVSRERADSIYYHVLLAEGEPEAIAKMMHDAVRAGGGAHYDADLVLDVSNAEPFIP